MDFEKGAEIKKLIFIVGCLLLTGCATEENVLAETESINANECNQPRALIAVPSIPSENIIMTVRGAIQRGEFGKALVHEHVMADFVGAEKAGPQRYKRDAVVETMLPFLRGIRQRGFTGLVDCTPAYLGRDVEVLRKLAELSDLNIVTNTGYYGAANDKFVPSHAFTETAEQLAGRWAGEWELGIDGTNIRPGFIKIGVDAGPLSEIDRKLVRAAAMAHLKTGLTIACHTGEGQAALSVLETVHSEGVAPSALIIVHADNIADVNVHIQVGQAGAWLGYDNISDKSIEKHVRLIKQMLEAGFTSRILISHDAGWYNVGEADGGRSRIRPYTAISDQLVGALKAAGVSDDKLHMLLVDNPAEAFTVKVRTQ